jgi:hypothetical protein
MGRNERLSALYHDYAKEALDLTLSKAPVRIQKSSVFGDQLSATSGAHGGT